MEALSRGISVVNNHTGSFASKSRDWHPATISSANNLSDLDQNLQPPAKNLDLILSHV
jgi:hypothetical protein